MKSKGKVIAVGIGPGAVDDITPRARAAIECADIIVGYVKYCELIQPLTVNKEVVSTGMKAEVARCETALRKAKEGMVVAVISSGDAGIYGMAGLLIELAERDRVEVEIEVVPGITAANAAAAALGAPLMNDFSVISLSDLLTDRGIIISRLESIAGSDMVCVIYNPRSTSRIELFDQALALFAEKRGAKVVAGYVKHASRKDQMKWVGTLKALPVEEVDMSTVVIIGSSNTEIIDGKMVTRRGYKGVTE